MKKIIFLLISATILFTNCGGSGNTAPSERPKTPEELKMELLAHEQQEPLTYLSIEASMQADEVKTRNAGLFHDAEYSPDGNTIHGTIINSATLAKYKDIVLTITFYSQTETAVESLEKVIYEFYSPNTATPFELKVYPPETMAKFGIEIKGATAVN
jgi:hypothetical protein